MSEILAPPAVNDGPSSTISSPQQAKTEPVSEVGIKHRLDVWLDKKKRETKAATKKESEQQKATPGQSHPTCSGLDIWLGQAACAGCREGKLKAREQHWEALDGRSTSPMVKESTHDPNSLASKADIWLHYHRKEDKGRKENARPQKFMHLIHKSANKSPGLTAKARGWLATG